MITYKNNQVHLEFTPLENGQNEYAVNLHDLGNLESIVNRTINGQELNAIIKLIEANKYSVNYLRYL